MFQFPIELKPYNDYSIVNPSDPRSQQVALDPPQLHKPPRPYVFTKTLNELRSAINEVNTIEKLAHTLGEDKYLTFVNIQRTYDLSMSTIAVDLLQDRIVEEQIKEEEMEDFNLFRSKTMQLQSARDMLTIGATRARDRLTKDRYHHQELFKLQNDFTLRASTTTQNVSMAGRRSYNTMHVINLGMGTGVTPIPQYRYIPVSIIRKHNNEIDLCLPHTTTAGKRALLASSIENSNNSGMQDESNEESSTIKQNGAVNIQSDFTSLLRTAQDSALDQELFELLSNACSSWSFSPSGVISVQERTDRRLRVKFNTKLIGNYDTCLVISLTNSGQFRTIECVVESGSQHDQSHTDKEAIKCLLREALLEIHLLYRRMLVERGKYQPQGAPTDPEFDQQAAALLDKALRHLCHRMSCQNIVKLLAAHVRETAQGSLSVLTTDYPDSTTLSIFSSTSGKQTIINIRGKQIDLQRGNGTGTIPFYEPQELLCFLKEGE